jgi:hypothetical protein
MGNTSYEVINRYHKKTYKRVVCLLRYDTDAELLEWLARGDTPTASEVLRKALQEEVAKEK